jgi:ElaB/YqjD/DUF883 family membrane-anchored ribosome-binding protein
MSKGFNNQLAARFKSLMYNRWILYFLFALSFGNIVYLGSLNDFGNIFVFALIGFLTTFFSKNMIVILCIALVFTNIIRYGTGIRYEGFELTSYDKTKITNAVNALISDGDNFDELAMYKKMIEMELDNEHEDLKEDDEEEDEDDEDKDEEDSDNEEGFEGEDDDDEDEDMPNEYKNLQEQKERAIRKQREDAKEKIKEAREKLMEAVRSGDSDEIKSANINSAYARAAFALAKSIRNPNDINNAKSEFARVKAEAMKKLQNARDSGSSRLKEEARDAVKEFADAYNALEDVTPVETPAATMTAPGVTRAQAVVSKSVSQGPVPAIPITQKQAPRAATKSGPGTTGRAPATRPVAKSSAPAPRPVAKSSAPAPRPVAKSPGTAPRGGVSAKPPSAPAPKPPGAPVGKK